MCNQIRVGLKTIKGSSTSLTLIINKKLQFKLIFVSFLTVAQPKLTHSLLSDADGAHGLPRPGSGCNLQASLGDYMLECIRIFQIHPRGGAAVPINWLPSFTSATG